MLEQRAQRGGRCLILGNIQGSEPSDLLIDVPDHCRRFGLDDF